jgi:hypothetical protein
MADTEARLVAIAYFALCELRDLGTDEPAHFKVTRLDLKAALENDEPLGGPHPRGPRRRSSQTTRPRLALVARDDA